MPNPRRRYPSDHRSYIRLLESFLDDEKVCALSLADQGLYVRLLLTLNRQESRDGRGTLSRFAACALAQRERWAYAKPAYDRLAAGGLVRLRYDTATVHYEAPKWAEIQGFTPAELRRDSGETPAPRGEERRGEKKSPSDSSSKVAENDPIAIKFAEDFRAALVRAHPGFKVPTPSAFQRWTTDARLLIAERGHDHARETARWLFDTATPNPDAEFWRGVILSVPKFRQKFEQLAAKRRTQHAALQQPQAGHHTSDLAERARAIVRDRNLRLAAANHGTD